MKNVCTIVPFKGEGHKSRLSHVMGAGQRLEFSLLMLDGVLKAIARAGLKPRCLVVSSNESAIRRSRLAGCRVVKERSAEGVNEAVRKGVASSKEDTFLVVPSDLPWLTGRDLKEALGLRVSGADMVISPSRAFDGTNLLLFSRDNRIALSYDSNSFWNHLASAASRGLKVAVYTGQGVVHDVDSVEDLDDLVRTRANTPSARFARKVLDRWHC